MGRNFDTVYPISHQIVLPTIGLPHGDFLILSFILHLLVINLLQGRPFLSFLHCGLTGPYFIPRVIICYCHYFEVQITPDLASGT